MARIVVTPADEDEVIVVGESGAERKEAEPSASPASGDAHAPIMRGKTGDEDSSPATPAVQGDMPKEEGDGAPVASSSSRSSGSARKTSSSSGAYREATLEDLESSPMPLAQKVVIVAAVVCIIGALVYYFVVMR